MIKSLVLFLLLFPVFLHASVQLSVSPGMDIYGDGMGFQTALSLTIPWNVFDAASVSGLFFKAGLEGAFAPYGSGLLSQRGGLIMAGWAFHLWDGELVVSPGIGCSFSLLQLSSSLTNTSTWVPGVYPGFTRKSHSKCRPVETLSLAFLWPIQFY